MINYTLTRSARKTIAIYIAEDATVKVRAPQQTNSAEIDHFVQSKLNWIEKQIALQSTKFEKKSIFVLNYGDTVLYHAKEYPIVPNRNGNIFFDHTKFYVPENLNPKYIKYAVIQIYKLLAEREITDLVFKYANIMKLSPTAVRINSARKRWGSCSGKNSINFTWYLILADFAAIEYVVVHELAHIKEHNHSKQFWAEVQKVLPDYKEREKGLDRLQERLKEEDWD